jgi:hypothetical protein
LATFWSRHLRPIIEIETQNYFLETSRKSKVKETKRCKVLLIYPRIQESFILFLDTEQEQGFLLKKLRINYEIIPAHPVLESSDRFFTFRP